MGRRHELSFKHFQTLAHFCVVLHQKSVLHIKRCDTKKISTIPGPVGKTPHVKMTSPWFNPSLGFAFFSKVSFLGRGFEGRFHPGRNVGTWDGQTDTPCLSARDPQKLPFFSLQMGIRIDKSMPRVREFEIFRMSNSDVDDEFESARYTPS